MLIKKLIIEYIMKKSTYLLLFDIKIQYNAVNGFDSFICLIRSYLFLFES